MSTHDGDNVVAFGAPHDGADDPVFEARLLRALQVPVPDNLVESILLRQTTEARHMPRARAVSPVWRIAAVFALAVSGLGLFLSSSAPVQALPELAVEHTLTHEPGATARTARVAPSQVRALFARSGIVLSTVPADVHYINLCELGRDMSLHMVSQQRAGPVTVFFVPGRREAHRMDFQQSGMSGRSVPLGNGALVLLAATDSDFDLVETHWRDALGAAR
jgi:hypothetical protein